jgi:hypothetical protein
MAQGYRENAKEDGGTCLFELACLVTRSGDMVFDTYSQQR